MEAIRDFAGDGQSLPPLLCFNSSRGQFALILFLQQM